MKINKLKWIPYISNRFSRVDRKGRSAVTSFLASLGIAFGVMTLIVVVSVMNGFQMSFIDSIIEISSCHIMVTSKNFSSELNGNSNDFLDGFSDFCASNKDIVSVMPFYESQCLLVGSNGNQSAVLLRAVSPDIYNSDNGFAKEVSMVSGSFNLSSDNAIVLGSGIAYTLGVHIGDTVNILALSGGSDIDLFSDDRVFTVSGIFSCNYSDITNAYVFIPFSAGKKMLGKSAAPKFGVKIKTKEHDAQVIANLEQFPDIECESWRSYNRSFFGALSVEKNLLMMLVFLIFVVVAVNIFNGMRRMVYERREEISVLSALGAKSSSVQSIFIMQGLIIGLRGAIPGLVLGLLLCVKMDAVFTFAANIVYDIQYFFCMLFSPQNAAMLSPNTIFLYYANIPARVMLNEVVGITLFGFFSALAASWVASRGILKLQIAEVLHDE